MVDAEQKPSISVKYDWYQTDATVVITILAKNVQKETAKIAFTEDCVSVLLALPDGSEHARMVILAHEIDPALCSYAVGTTKVEVKLRKREGIRWESLEAKAGAETVKQIPQEVAASSGPPSYPTSKGTNWTAVERELQAQEAQEKPAGEEALNKLFQEIYGKGDDNVKRAMNKSYMESGGTVLSTNWGEISKDRVAIKPPDGMEFKKWDS